MYKRILLLVLAALLIFTAGCRKKSADPTRPAETTVPTETLPPGAVYVDKDLAIEDATETELTTPDEIEDEVTEPAVDEAKPEKETEPEAEKETAPVQKPEENETVPPTTPPSNNVNNSAYSQYMHMSEAEQQAFIESFGSIADFMDWLNQAKAEHNANDNSVEIGSGTVDLEQITGNKDN